MPKKSQKSNQREVADDFDDMLASFRAADLINAQPSHVAQKSADDIPSNAARAQAPEVTVVPEATIFAAIRTGDLARLRRWHRQGVQMSAEHLCMAAGLGSIALMR
jgi:hypothetical protein